MSSVWLTIPSARPPAEVEPVLAKWKERGYYIALWRDSWISEEVRCDYPRSRHHREMQSLSSYPGYAIAVNRLIQSVMLEDSAAEWFIAAGDDTLPDPNHLAEQVATSCFLKFGGTFGCMQPTGDTWRDVQGRIIERIAGSAWLGREFCKRINQGEGPLWPEYTHCFVDEELQCVAQKYGVFWQRPDLIHHHEHWARKNGDVRDMPAHLKEANSREHWDKYKGIFTARKAAGFPGSEPL